MLCCAVLCCAVLCCAVLCCAVLCCAVLCCVVLCCVVLCCCVVLRCAVLLYERVGEVNKHEENKHLYKRQIPGVEKDRRWHENQKGRYGEYGIAKNTLSTWIANIYRDRGENLKELIYCQVDINLVEDNERISKWTRLFKLSKPFSRYRSLKLRFMMRNSDKVRLFSQQISR